MIYTEYKPTRFSFMIFHESNPDLILTILDDLRLAKFIEYVSRQRSMSYRINMILTSKLKSIQEDKNFERFDYDKHTDMRNDQTILIRLVKLYSPLLSKIDSYTIWNSHTDLLDFSHQILTEEEILDTFKNTLTRKTSLEDISKDKEDIITRLRNALEYHNYWLDRMIRSTDFDRDAYQRDLQNYEIEDYLKRLNIQ